MRRYQRIIIGLCLILVLISACSHAPMIENEIENNPEPDATATPIEPAEIEEIIDDPIPVIDVSEWIVAVGGLECPLDPYRNDYPGWYMADCPEQLWFPIKQITQVNISEDICTIKPIGDFEIAIRDLSMDAMPVEFVQMDEGGWGCQIPYSDTAGTEVVCGFECDGEETRVILQGKTIRVYSGRNGGSSGNGGSSENGNGVGNGGNQSVPPPRPTDSPD